MEARQIEEHRLVELERNDKEAHALQEADEYNKALETMEVSLHLRKELFGDESCQFWDACPVVGQLCNTMAMTHLQQEDLDGCLELLRKAEILTERSDLHKAVTFNNLACYYRHRGQLRHALKYLHRALKIEGKLQLTQNEADTHLNLCAILSELEQHRSALDHARSALILLQENLLSGAIGGNPRHSPPDIVNGDIRYTVAPDQRVRPPVQSIAVLGVAYYNAGVELEFLGQTEQSRSSYRKGLDVGATRLGPNHFIMKILRNSYDMATEGRRCIRRS